MKKCLSLIISAIMIAVCTLPCYAISITSGHDLLCKQFLDGQIDGNMDYVYYSPVKNEADTTKYPLVIWLHGRSSGEFPRKQITSYDFSNWASDEYQVRFKDTGGAFLVLPRSNSPTNTWTVGMTVELKTFIDEVIERYSPNIDTDRIYLGGYSAGGSMVYHMLGAYPDYFTAGLPMSSVYQPTQAEISQWQDLSLWIFCSDNDFYPSGSTVSTMPLFTYLSGITNRKTGVRMTNVSQTLWADGTRDSELKMNHYVWDTVIYDMHMTDGSPFKNTTTRDADGNIITFEKEGSGVIDWLYQQKKPSGNEAKSFLDRIVDFFRSIYKFIVSVFSV